MRWLFASFVSFASILALSLGAPVWAHSLDELEGDLGRQEPHVSFAPGIGVPFPAFRLGDPDGHIVDSAAFLGKVVVLDFLSGRCGEDCRRQDGKVAQIQRDVAVAHMSGRVRFVGITVDPEHDTAPLRKAYAVRHGLDPSNWVFLAPSTGSVARALAAQAGVKVAVRPDGSFAPSAVVAVIDDDGKLRARFLDADFDPLNVVVYINALVNDPHHHDPHNHGPVPSAHAAPSASSLWARLKALL